VPAVIRICIEMKASQPELCHKKQKKKNIKKRGENAEKIKKR